MYGDNQCGLGRLRAGCSRRDDIYSTLLVEPDTQLENQWLQFFYRRTNPCWHETVFSLINAGKWASEGNSSWEDFSRPKLNIAWKKIAEGHTTWDDINCSDYQHPLAKSLLLLGRNLRSIAVPL
ncbi:hypothetical protein FS594_14135 [Rahnella aquatilis]|nr:hypothetical protein FS594_14135 [Rahnella aquatilis]